MEPPPPMVVCGASRVCVPTPAGCPLAVWGPPSGAWGAARFGWLPSRWACARAAVGAKPARRLPCWRWARGNREAAESPAGRRAARVPAALSSGRTRGVIESCRSLPSRTPSQGIAGACDGSRPRGTPKKQFDCPERVSSCVAQVRCALALALRQPFGALWCSFAGRRERLSSADKRSGARTAVGMLTIIMPAPLGSTDVCVFL